MARQVTSVWMCLGLSLSPRAKRPLPHHPSRRPLQPHRPPKAGPTCRRGSLRRRADCFWHAPAHGSLGGMMSGCCLCIGSVRTVDGGGRISLQRRTRPASYLALPHRHPRNPYLAQKIMATRSIGKSERWIVPLAFGQGRQHIATMIYDISLCASAPVAISATSTVLNVFGTCMTVSGSVFYI